ncbi:hypothetical protein ACLOJK_027569 [Asimina triloba]
MHCQVAEISRILRSGGVFVGTTFLAPAFGDSVPYDMFRSLRQNISTLTNSYNNLTEREIQELCKTWSTNKTYAISFIIQICLLQEESNNFVAP